MIAMNYQIKLPADYDMEIIRNRVKNNGYKTDGMNSFLPGGPFNNILSSFGWTQVNTWNVLHQHISVQNENQYAVIFHMKVQRK
jgi:hypothetical protein